MSANDDNVSDRLLHTGKNCSPYVSLSAGARQASVSSRRARATPCDTDEAEPDVRQNKRGSPCHVTISRSQISLRRRRAERCGGGDAGHAPERRALVIRGTDRAELPTRVRTGGAHRATGVNYNNRAQGERIAPSRRLAAHPSPSCPFCSSTATRAATAPHPLRREWHRALLDVEQLRPGDITSEVVIRTRHSEMRAESTRERACGVGALWVPDASTNGV